MMLPEGLMYVPGFLTEAEERDVLAVLAGCRPGQVRCLQAAPGRTGRAAGRWMGSGCLAAGCPAASLAVCSRVWQRPDVPLLGHFAGRLQQQDRQGQGEQGEGRQDRPQHPVTGQERS